MNIEEVLQLIKEIQSSHTIKVAYLEHVTARSGQGVTSMFRFGQNLGQWQGLLKAQGFQVNMIRPQSWKAQLKLINSEKLESIELARDLFPDNGTDFKYKKADEGRAESSLIAHCGWELTYPGVDTISD